MTCKVVVGACSGTGIATANVTAANLHWVTTPLVTSNPPYDTCAPVSFQAHAAADCGGQISYEWNFGDGSGVTTTSTTVSHQYTAGGARTVTCVAHHTSGDLNWPPIGISVTYVAPTLTITQHAITPPSPDTCTQVTLHGAAALTCTAAPITYQWTVVSWPQGATPPSWDPGADVSGTFSTAGSYGLKLTVSATGVADAVWTTTLDVAQGVPTLTAAAPTVGSPRTMCDTIEFTTSSTQHCIEGTPTYTWEFSRRTTVIETVAGQPDNVSRNFGYMATHKVRVRADLGDVHSAWTEYREFAVAQGNGGVKGLTGSASKYSPYTCESVTLTASATADCTTDPIVCTWFDGTTQIGQGATRTESFTAGTHTVRVEATAGGTPAVVFTLPPIVVTQSDPGVFDLQVSPTTLSFTTCDRPQLTASVQLHCASGTIEYEWDFGDGTPHEFGTSVTHQWKAASDEDGYTLTVTARLLQTQYSTTLTRQVVVTTGPGHPGVPTNVAVGPLSNGKVSVSWNAAANATSYEVWRKAGSGAYAKTKDVLAPTVSVLDDIPQTATDTVYCWQVRAVAGGCGDGVTGEFSSPEICVTIPCNGQVTVPAPTVDEDRPVIGQEVTFTSAASGRCQTAQLRYTWDFNDNTIPETTTTNTVSHTYFAPKAVGPDGNTIAPYEVTVTVTDGSSISAESDPCNVWVQPCAVDLSPGPGEAGTCATCGGTGVSADIQSGNIVTQAGFELLTATSGLTMFIAVNSQVVEPSRPMGNATFTFDAHIAQSPVYENGQGAMHWFVVDGNGKRLNFGLASGSPSPGVGVHSQLVVLGGSAGYLLQNAGPLEALGEAGNYTYAFDAAGKLTQVTDYAGNTQTVTYTSSGKVQQVTDGSTGKSIVFYWTGSRITTIFHSASGAAKTRLIYTPEGRLATVKQCDGNYNPYRTFVYAYNTDGSLASAALAGVSTTNFTYTALPSKDGASQVLMANAVDAGGMGSTQIGYALPPRAGAARTIQVRNNKGGVFLQDFNSAGDLIRATTPQLAGASSPTTVDYSWDGARNLTGVAVNGSPVASMTYTANGQLSSYTDALGHTWSWTYSGVDLLTATDPVGSTASLTYGNTSKPHIPTAYTDPLGRVWTATLNAAGQVTGVTPPTGSPTGTATVTYGTSGTSKGYPIDASDAMGNHVTFDQYDALGDLTRYSTYPITGTTNTEILTYDPMQRLTRVQHPDGKQVNLAYSGRDLVQAVDEAGSIYTFGYCSPCGTMTSVAGPLNWGLQWTLDSDKDLTAFTDARGAVTQYGYGQAGELTQVTYPDASTIGVQYDNRARVSQVNNGRTQPVTLAYDAADRLTGVTTPDTSIGYAYNADNTLQQMTDSAGTTAVSYLATGDVSYITHNYAARGLTPLQRVDYAYNPDGSRASMTWTSGGVVMGTWSYGYDAAGRLTSVTNGWNETTTWSYDGEGKLVSQTNANTTSVSYGYNQQRGWPTNITWKRGATTFAGYGLTYDGGLNKVGNLTGITESGGPTVTYGYDALYRLTSEARTGAGGFSHSYGYDLAGNRTVADALTSTYDAANKLTGLLCGGVPCSWTAHDGDGNLTSVSGTGVPDRLLSWNTFSQLTSSGAGVTMEYVYDGFGRRVVAVGGLAVPGDGMGAGTGGAEEQSLSRARIMSTVPSTNQTYYVFDGDLLIGEVDGAGLLKAAYTWGANGLVSARLGGTRSVWYAFGPQGETRQLTDASGVVTSAFTYTSYGVPVSWSGEITPFQYGGQFGYYTDTNNWPNSLILCGARWYDPYLGRWTSRDPIDYGGGPNLYEYCGSEPVGAVDPSGLAPKIDPRKLRFAQNDCKMNLGGGGTILSLADEMRSGTVDWDRIGVIRVVRHNGMLWTLDHRRVVAAGLAKVDVPYIEASLQDPRVAAEFFGKLDTKTQGRLISVLRSKKDPVMLMQYVAKFGRALKGATKCAVPDPEIVARITSEDPWQQAVGLAAAAASVLGPPMAVEPPGNALPKLIPAGLDRKLRHISDSVRRALDAAKVLIDGRSK